MRNFFDTPFYHMLCTIFDMVILNACFLICCLPFVTIGAAVSALYRTFYDVQKGEGSALKDFFRFFRSALKKGVPGWLLWVILFAIACADFFIVGLMWDFSARYLILGILAGIMLLLLLTGSTLFPILSYYRSLRQAAKDALRFSVCHLLRVVPVCLLNLVPLLLLLFWMYGLFLLLAVFVLIWFSLSAYVSVFLLKPVLQQAESQLYDLK